MKSKTEPMSRERWTEMRPGRHRDGYFRVALSRKRHGECFGGKPTPEYSRWKAMHQRCSNPKSISWKSYGGRGITVCQRWSRFENFLADMGRAPAGTTLDRIDTSKGYEPDNCRWASAAVQARNRRPNIIVSHDGRTQTATDWARELGVHPSTMLLRIKRWGPLRALTELAPKKRRKGVKK